MSFHLCFIFIFFLASITHANPSFSLNTIATDYKLQSGRPSVCPPTVSYTSPNQVEKFIPAASTSAAEFSCVGKGGKKLQDGQIIRNQGLQLPSLVSNPDILFYAGVESATRVCGSWAFNASSISWYLFNPGSKAITDSETGINIQPGYIYLTYAHFGDLCVYRTLESNRVEPPKKNETSNKPQHSNTQPEKRRECFPHDATVLLESGKRITMQQLNIGDKVLVSKSALYSQVFAFSHQDAFSITSFLKLTTVTGKSIKLTPGHILYINGQPKAAKHAVVGDVLTVRNGLSETINNIHNVKARGLYNPQTLTGDIIVNDVLATTWTESVRPVLASSLLSPVRMLYRVTSQDIFSYIHKWLNSVLEMTRSF